LEELILKQNEIKNLTKVINNFIASKTSSTLSKLLSEPIDYNIMILDKKYFDIKNLKLPNDEIKMCGVRLEGKGDTQIEILCTIKTKYAKKLASKLLGQDVHGIYEMEASVIQKVANILTGSFFNAMAIGTGFRVELSTPNYLHDDISSLIETSAENIIRPSNLAIIADTELIGKSSGIRMHMLIMQNPQHARKLLANHTQFI